MRGSGPTDIGGDGWGWKSEDGMQGRRRTTSCRGTVEGGKSPSPPQDIPGKKDPGIDGKSGERPLFERREGRGEKQKGNRRSPGEKVLEKRDGDRRGGTLGGDCQTGGYSDSLPRGASEKSLFFARKETDGLNISALF